MQQTQYDIRLLLNQAIFFSKTDLLIFLERAVIELRANMKNIASTTSKVIAES